MSRLQEATVVLQERAWVQEAVGDLAKGGKFLLDAITTRASNNTPSARVAVIGSSGIFIPSYRSTTKVGGAADMDVSYNARKGVVTQAESTGLLKDEDCTWETDPNGGWLGSFQ